MPVGRIYSALAVLLLWSRRRFSWIVLSSVLTACAGDLVLPGTDGGGGPTVIRVVKGDGQKAAVGEVLPAPVVVEVTDAEALPVEGATVEFELISAGDGASMLPSTRTTGPNGRAEAQVLLGDKVGLQTGEARVVGDAASKASFTALATPNDHENESPDADYNWHCEDLVCEFTDASTDDDGSVVGWDWQFGDGDTSQDAEPSHRYPAPGTYIVTLTVTDNDGSMDQASAHVDVTNSESESD